MPERKGTYWQGQMDARMARMETDLAEIKAGVNGLKLWRAKVLGGALAVSVVVSWLLHYMGVR